MAKKKRKPKLDPALRQQIAERHVVRGLRRSIRPFALGAKSEAGSLERFMEEMKQEDSRLAYEQRAKRKGGRVRVWRQEGGGTKSA